MDYKGNLWSAILALIVGIAMVFFSDIALHTIVRIVGVLFITTAVLNIAFALGRQRDARKSQSPSSTAIISSAGTGILGVLMVFTPADMVSLMIYLFAISIALLGIYQIIILAYAYKPVSFPGWFYILPSLLVITGVVICIIGAQAVGTLMIRITGIALITYAVATFLNIIGLITFRRRLTKNNAKPEVEDVRAEEVPNTNSHNTSSAWPSDRN